MIRRLVFLGISALAGPAAADMATIKLALADTCIAALPDLTETHWAFQDMGWMAFNGGIDEEYQFFSGTTRVFLRALPLAEMPECAVSDAALSLDAAPGYLENVLQSAYPGLWQAGTDRLGRPEWRLQSDEFTAFFRIREGWTGGAEILFEARP